jgi:hypothetical protein
MSKGKGRVSERERESDCSAQERVENEQKGLLKNKHNITIIINI